MKNSILFSLLFFMASCTQPEPKPTCQYSVTANPCTIPLVYTPKMLNGESDLGHAVILQPKQYTEVVFTFEGNDIKGFCLNGDVSKLCDADYNVFMDKDKTYPYEKAMAVITQYKAIKEQELRNKKRFDNYRKQLISQL